MWDRASSCGKFSIRRFLTAAKFVITLILQGLRNEYSVKIVSWKEILFATKAMYEMNTLSEKSSI